VDFEFFSKLVLTL